MFKNNWLEENFTPYEKHLFKIKNVLVDKKTKFQQMMLVDMELYKRCLILDGELQSSELDEFVYHESIVHPAMIFHGNPERALILGGGEGATLREVLKYKSVKEVVMVDIDGEVIEFCKEYLPMFHKNSFYDERAKIVICDAKDYIFNKNEKFDVIISDLCCPIEDSPAASLYTKEFYEVLKTHLNPAGLFLVQAGPAEIPQFRLFSLINKTLRSVFPEVFPFSITVPSSIVSWGFQLASLNPSRDPLANSDFEIDTLINQKLFVNDLNFYDGITHRRMFSLPKHLRKLLDEETEIIAEKNLHFLFK